VSGPTFTPINPLEQLLLRIAQGWAKMEEFIAALPAARVVLLTDKEVGPTWDEAVLPLALRLPEGPLALAVFTAKERTLPWLHQFPQFNYVVELDFPAVLARMQPGAAMLINPGWPQGLILRSDALAGMKDGLFPPQA
jgi:hypothetical protein